MTGTMSNIVGITYAFCPAKEYALCLMLSNSPPTNLGGSMGMRGFYCIAKRDSDTS